MKRRHFLAVIAAATPAVAGCTGEQTGQEADCQTERIGGADQGVIQQATVAPEDGTAILEVVFTAETASETGTSRLSVYQGDELLHLVPVGDERTYGITIGDLPFHGAYRIVASDSDGTELDTMVIEFNCVTDG